MKKNESIRFVTYSFGNNWLADIEEESRAYLCSLYLKDKGFKEVMFRLDKEYVTDFDDVLKMVEMNIASQDFRQMYVEDYAEDTDNIDIDGPVELKVTDCVIEAYSYDDYRIEISIYDGTMSAWIYKDSYEIKMRMLSSTASADGIDDFIDTIKKGLSGGKVLPIYEEEMDKIYERLDDFKANTSDFVEHIIETETYEREGIYIDIITTSSGYEGWLYSKVATIKTLLEEKSFNEISYEGFKSLVLKSIEDTDLIEKYLNTVKDLNALR